MLKRSMVRSHLRKMRHRKMRRRRQALTCFFALVMLYLGIIGTLQELFWNITSERTIEHRMPDSMGREGGTLRITFRLRSGEILIYYEDSETHNEDSVPLIK